MITTVYVCVRAQFRPIMADESKVSLSIITRIPFNSRCTDAQRVLTPTVYASMLWKQ